MHRSALMTAAWVCLAAAGAYGSQQTQSSPDTRTQPQQKGKEQRQQRTQAEPSGQPRSVNSSA